MQFFNMITNCKELKALLILVVLDTIFGSLRALKEKKINSNIGIDGLIRKFGMMISVLFFILIDMILEINLISFIPENIRTSLKLESIGVSHLFLWLFVIYESLSVLKNMVKCKLPIPKKFQSFLEKVFNKYTTELIEKGEEK